MRVAAEPGGADLLPLRPEPLAPRRELLPWTGFTMLAGFLLGGLYALIGLGMVIWPLLAA